jgi:hypothetical protein
MDAGSRGEFKSRPYISPDPYATFASVLTGFDARFGAVRRLCPLFADGA